MELGEVCWGRGPTDTAAQHKVDSSREAYVWLGKVETSDEHILGRGSNVTKVRVVRRRPEEERWNRALFDACVTTPWSETEQVVDQAISTRTKYITRGEVAKHGPTDGCRGCSLTAASTPQCAARGSTLSSRRSVRTGGIGNP